jgi:SagB-type dehydrogenase family enzyme
MRLVRSPNIVASWRGSRFCLEEFVRRRRIAAAPIAVELLDEFSRPRSIASVARAFRTYTPASVAREIRRLAGLGFLVPAADRAARRDVAAEWRDSLPAAHLHFAGRDVSYVTDPGAHLRYLRRRLAEESQPARFKRYPGRPRVALPDSSGRHPMSLDRALESRRTVREFTTMPVPLSDFADVIRGTWGQTGWIEAGPLGRLLARSSPSAGARHPIECYMLVWNVEGVAPGLYHYNVRGNFLERLRRGDLRAQAARLAAAQGWIRKAAFLCVMTAVARRIFWKYSSDEAYRLFFLDAGHLAQTFALLSTARGLGPFTTAAMRESRIEGLLGLDGVSEFPVYLCGAGVPSAPAARRAPGSGRVSGRVKRPSRRRP